MKRLRYIFLVSSLILVSSFFAICNGQNQEQIKRDSIRQQKLLEVERGRYLADSAKRVKNAELKDFMARTHNIITWAPISLVYEKVELMYERSLTKRFSVGLSAMYKFRTNKTPYIKERTYNTSPAWGGMPFFGSNQYNGYGNIWQMPFSEGYSLGAFSKCYFLRNMLYVHGELFGQYASFDNVNVTWSKKEAGAETSDSLRASVTSAGLKILVGSSLNIPVSQKVGLFFEYFIGCSMRLDYADLFHYRQTETDYSSSGEQGIVLKEMEPEKVTGVTIKPQTGVRIGLRF